MLVGISFQILAMAEKSVFAIIGSYIWQKNLVWNHTWCYVGGRRILNI